MDSQEEDIRTWLPLGFTPEEMARRYLFCKNKTIFFIFIFIKNKANARVAQTFVVPYDVLHIQKPLIDDKIL